MTGALGAKYMPEEPELAMLLSMSGGMGVGLRLGRVVKANSLRLVKLLLETTFKATPHRQEFFSPCKYQSLLYLKPPFVSAMVTNSS